MSVHALTWAFDQQIPWQEKFLLVTLANFASDQGECYVLIDTLVRLTAMSRRVLQRHTADLERRGLISKQRRFGRSSIWKLAWNIDAIAPTVAQPISPERATGGLMNAPQVTPRTVPSSIPEDLFPLDGEERAPKEVRIRGNGNGHSPRWYLIRDYIIVVCHWNREGMTDSNWAWASKAATEIDRLDVDPGYVLGFEDVWEAAHPGVEINPTIITKHWAEYQAGRLSGLPRR